MAPAWPSLLRPGTSSTSSTRTRAGRSAGSPRATRRTRTTTPPTAAHLPRQHRDRLHADRPTGARHDEGRSPLPDRRREHEPDRQATRHGPEARGGRLPEHELRGAADGAHERRVEGLLPGLLLPRLRRVRLRPGPRDARRQPAERGPGDPARAVPARLRAPRHRDEPRRHAPVRRGDDVGLRGDRRSQHVRLHADPRRQKPYWSTNSADGRYCFVSWSGDDKISAISYKTKAEVAQIPVGDHPQRMRIGSVTRAWLQARQ